MTDQPAEQAASADETPSAAGASSDSGSSTPPEERKSSTPPEGASAPPAAEGEQGAFAGSNEPPAPSELEQVTAERDKLRDQLMRTAADFDNYRKRSRRELEDAKARGQLEVVRDLLPVFDNLERAVQASQTASDVNSVLEGIRMVLKLFEDTSDRMGLTRVKSMGERFDPAVHEAIQQKESDEAAPGTILAEVVPGYRFGERLVRAAMVVVARKPNPPKKNSDDARAASESAAPSGAPSQAPADAAAAGTGDSASPGRAASDAPQGSDTPEDAAVNEASSSQPSPSEHPTNWPPKSKAPEGGSEGQGA